MEKFRHGEAVFEFVRWQLVAGAKAALAFAHAHNPEINLKAIGMGPPPAPGGRAMHMDAHYAAATEAAESVVKLIEAETDSIRQQQGEPW